MEHLVGSAPDLLEPEVDDLAPAVAADERAAAAHDPKGDD
jgi:hypothetical protein